MERVAVNQGDDGIFDNFPGKGSRSMDARFRTAFFALGSFLFVAASHRSPNFFVNAPTPEIAREVATTAERYRSELAVEWLGQELPNWARPCTVTVRVGQVGAGGVTSFNFDRGEVYGWNMTLQGPYDRILDSVLPHEVSHTIFACYFRRPLPRWADEGAATLAEIDSERRRQTTTARQVLGNRQHIPLRKLVGMKEYPTEMRDVMTLYAEGYSLAELLVQRSGKTVYLNFLNDAHYIGWEQAVQKHYGYRGLEELEQEWHGWIMAGSPPLQPVAGQQIADATAPGKRTGTEPTNPAVPPGTIIRAQSPANDPFLEPKMLTSTAAAFPPKSRSDLQAPPPRRVSNSPSTAPDADRWVPVTKP